MAAPITHAPPPGPVEDPESSAQGFAHPEAVAAFRDQHLDLRGSSQWRGGSEVVSLPYFGWSTYRGVGWGVGASTVLRGSVEPRGEWAVFQGIQRLSVPSYLELVGDDLRHNALQADIAQATRRGKVGYGVAAAGVVALVAGYFGASTASTPEELGAWNGVTLGGVCALVGGALGGNSASSRARRLEIDFRSTVAFDDTCAQVDTYNETLRDGLGLSPAEAARVLTEQPARGRRR